MANAVLAIPLFNLKYKNYLMLKIFCILLLYEVDNVSPCVIMLHIKHVTTGSVHNYSTLVTDG